MPTKKNRTGQGEKLHVPSITEALGMGGRMKVGTPKPVHVVSQNAGAGAGKAASGKKGAAEPIKTIHKGKGWDGPPVKKHLPGSAPGKKSPQ